MQTTIGARLASAVPFVTQGARVADIGTDHAYLPIYLVEKGIASAAIACDVNRGPLDSAVANIREAGLSDQIETLLADGLHGVENFAPTDVLIFGMGGELIVRILSEAPWIRRGDVNLILQPMSRAATLRRWLVENGFAITDEAISLEDRYYQTVVARYCGEKTAYTACECQVGRRNIESRPPLFEGLLRHEIAVLETILRGKARSLDADATEELRLKTSLEELL